MSVFIEIECKNEKLAEKLMDKLGGKKGVLSVGLATEAEEVQTEVEDLPMPKPNELKKLLTELKETLGKEALVNLYETHDAEKLKDLAKEEWPTVFAEATQLLEAHATKPDKKDKTDKKEKAGKKTKKSKDDVKTSLEDTMKLCGKVASSDSLDASRDILKEFGHNTTRTLKKADQPTLNSIAAAMRNALK